MEKSYRLTEDDLDLVWRLLPARLSTRPNETVKSAFFDLVGEVAVLREAMAADPAVFPPHGFRLEHEEGTVVREEGAFLVRWQMRR